MPLAQAAPQSARPAQIAATAQPVPQDTSSAERAVSHNAQTDSTRTSKLEPAHHAKSPVEPAPTPLNATPANPLSSRESLMANATLDAQLEPTPAATTNLARPVTAAAPPAKTLRTVLHAHQDYSSMECNVETPALPDTTETPPTTSADSVTPLVAFAQDLHQTSAHNVPQPTFSLEPPANQDVLTVNTSQTAPAMPAPLDALSVTTKTPAPAAKMDTS